MAAIAAAPSSAAASPPPSRVAVVFVGGLGSTPSGTAANFGRLAAELRGQAGYAAADLSTFAYSGGQTCQPIAISTAELAAYVRRLRDGGAFGGVILVGHSNGGVVALGVPIAAPDLVEPGAPFVHRIVTVDSPVLGILTGDAMVMDAHLGGVVGPCVAADELLAEQANPGWPDYMARVVAWEQERSVGVYLVVNPSDWAVDVSRQQVPGVDVNYAVDVTDSGLNHAAVLKTGAGVAALLPMVGPQAAP